LVGGPWSLAKWPRQDSEQRVEKFEDSIVVKLAND